MKNATLNLKKYLASKLVSKMRSEIKDNIFEVEGVDKKDLPTGLIMVQQFAKYPANLVGETTQFRIDLIDPVSTEEITDLIKGYFIPKKYQIDQADNLFSDVMVFVKEGEKIVQVVLSNYPDELYVSVTELGL